MKETGEEITVRSYSARVLPELGAVIDRNEAALARVADAVVESVKSGRSLFTFGSGHSAIFSLELYHRAGGASFVIPMIAEHLLPTAGPPVVRVFERTPGAATMLLDRYRPQAGEMLWLCSQSGINAAIVDLAIEAKKRGLRAVAFTSLAHSRGVASRHASGKRLFEICDETIDLGGAVGDALLPIAPGVSAGPFSTLGAILAAHSILAVAQAKLERARHRCTYTSVNTPEGEARNKDLEARAAERDFFLR